MGPGVVSVIVAIAVASLPNFARVSRSAIVPEKEREYVLAAHVVGAPTWHIIARTLLPNLIGPLMVLISLGFAYAVLYEASLSFLGLGARPPTPEWGVMLSTARDFIFQAPWYAFFPGIAIVILVFSLNLVGDGLRDAIDPYRTRR
jgi:dipeptide transport system permease protein